jgi:uncharacterized protein (TIGR02145 family)
MAPDVWKEFDCYNLAAIGKTTNDDPFNPSWRLIGGYWQWGRKGPDSSQWYDTNTEHFAHGPTGPDETEANNVIVGRWDPTNTALNGAWSGTTKPVNDPCPEGYRVPSKDEWNDLLANNEKEYVGNSWESGATNYGSGLKFGDALFLPAAGMRYDGTGAPLHNRGKFGYYWSSSEDIMDSAWMLYFTSGLADTHSFGSQTYGNSVRCISE